MLHVQTFLWDASYTSVMLAVSCIQDIKIEREIERYIHIVCAILRAFANMLYTSVYMCVRLFSTRKIARLRVRRYV